MNANALACNKRATQLPDPTTALGRLKVLLPCAFSRASRNTSSVCINCKMSAIINETEDVAAAHESQYEASAVA